MATTFNMGIYNDPNCESHDFAVHGNQEFVAVAVHACLAAPIAAPGNLFRLTKTNNNGYIVSQKDYNLRTMYVDLFNNITYVIGEQNGIILEGNDGNN